MPGSDSLIFPQALRDRVLAHALSEAPREACGILGGRDSVVEAVFEIVNADSSNITYMMEPKEQFRVIKQLRHLDMEMVGIYHSHPATEAYPSPTDRKLAFYPEAFYVIVSLEDSGNPLMRVFRMNEGAVSEGVLIL